MPVGFLTQEQRDGFGRYIDAPSRDELERYFHLSDEDREAVQILRGNHNRLGYAVLLTTVRFVGILPDKPAAVPVEGMCFVDNWQSPTLTVLRVIAIIVAGYMQPIFKSAMGIATLLTQASVFV